MTRPIKMWVSHGHLQSTIDTWLPLPLQPCPPTRVPRAPPVNYRQTCGFPCPSSPAPIAAHFLVLS